MLELAVIERAAVVQVVHSELKMEFVCFDVMYMSPLLHVETISWNT